MAEQLPTQAVIDERTRQDSDVAQVAADAMRPSLEAHDREPAAGYFKTAEGAGAIAVRDILTAEQKEAEALAQVDTDHAAAIAEDIDRKSVKDPEFAYEIAAAIKPTVDAHLEEPKVGFDVVANEIAVREGQFMNDAPRREAAHRKAA